MGPALTALKMLQQPKNGSGTDLIPKYEREFAHTIIGNDTPTLAFNRGRVALWAILKGIGVDETSEVILPAYTCETVPMAIKFAGAKCVYADVPPGRYNVSPNQIYQALSSHSRVVICQHTYGIAQHSHEWSKMVSDEGLLLVEDRCQFVVNGTSEYYTPLAGQAAYFSTHFNKPFSTGQGGLAVFGNTDLYDAVERIRSEFPHDGDRKRVRCLSWQVLLYYLTVRPMTRAFIGNIFRWAQRAGIIRGTVSVDEYGKLMPKDYLSRSSNFQASLGIQQLRCWRENCRHRRRLTRFYMEKLANLGIDVSFLAETGNDPVLLMVPLLVDNKKDILRFALKRSLPIGTWFDRKPVHINHKTAHLYDYEPGLCPNTEYLIDKEIHLLTAPWVGESQAARAIEFVNKYAKLTNHRIGGLRPRVEPSTVQTWESHIPAK